MELTRWHALGPALLLAVVSWTVAFIDVVQDDWFGSGDLWPFVFWCVVAGAVAYPVMQFLQRRMARVGSLLLLCLASLSGLGFAIAWFLLMVLILGGWIGAFSFPVFFCWIVGSVLAFLASAVVVRPRVWPGAAALALGLPIAAAAILAWLLHAPPNAIIYYKPATTDEEYRYLWDRIRDTTTEDSKHPGGVRSWLRVHHGERAGIKLTFRPRTSEERRTEILSSLRSLPFIDDIVDSPLPSQGSSDARKVNR